MATYKIVYWKDIPSIVQAKDDTGTVKRELGERFQTLIDAVAMHLGLTDADEYLEQWHHGDEEQRPGSARDVAQSIVDELESRFEEFRERGLGAP